MGTYYGPWIDPPEYTETWRLGPDPDNSGRWGVLEQKVEPHPQASYGSLPAEFRRATMLDPLSGMVAGRSGYGLERRLIGEPEFPPGYGSDEPSQEAWHTAVHGTGGSEGFPYLRHYAAIGYLSFETFSYLNHSEQWQASSWDYRPDFRSANWDYSAFAEVESGAKDVDSEGKVIGVMNGVNVERPWVATLTEVTSMKLIYDLGFTDSRWHIYVKDFNEPSVNWTVSPPYTSPEVFSVPSGRSVGRGPGEYSFNIEELEIAKQAAAEAQASNSPFFLPREWAPHIGLRWIGDWPGDVAYSSEFVEKRYDVGPLVFKVEVKWKPSRFRYVFRTPYYGRLKVKTAEDTWRYAEPLSEEEGPGVLKVKVEDDSYYGDGSFCYPAGYALKIKMPDGSWVYPNAYLDSPPEV